MFPPTEVPDYLRIRAGSFAPRDISARLSWLTEGITWAALQDLVGMNYETIRLQTVGKSRPSVEFCCRLARVSGVSIEWILLGEGEAWPDKALRRGA